MNGTIQRLPKKKTVVMRNCSYSVGWISVKEGSDAAINSLAIISNFLLEQLDKVVTRGEASLDVVHSTYCRGCWKIFSNRSINALKFNIVVNKKNPTKPTPIARKKIHHWNFSKGSYVTMNVSKKELKEASKGQNANIMNTFKRC